MKEKKNNKKMKKNRKKHDPELIFYIGLLVFIIVVAFVVNFCSHHKAEEMFRGNVQGLREIILEELEDNGIKKVEGLYGVEIRIDPEDIEIKLK